MHAVLPSEKCALDVGAVAPGRNRVFVIVDVKLYLSSTIVYWKPVQPYGATSSVIADALCSIASAATSPSAVDVNLMNLMAAYSLGSSGPCVEAKSDGEQVAGFEAPN